MKGVSAAAEIVREGGSIILAAECRDGLPDHGGYAKFLAEAGAPQTVLEMLARPDFKMHDQWTVQVQAKILLRSDVYVYSSGLSDQQIPRALFIPCRSIEQTVADLLAKTGPEARICVLPEGPQTIPYLRERVAEPAAH